MSDANKVEMVATALYDHFEAAEYADWDGASGDARVFCLALAKTAIATLEGEQ